CHPDFVRCLFEQEIPEIADRTIEIKAVAREAGYRTKIAVSSIDTKVDCVGACVGGRGSRIKTIIDELGGERIDIVRWNDSLQVLIPNALQPAEITEVFLYPRLGRAIVLVAEDQLSLAIGRRGQNVRLASKLVGWDIEIMTVEELDESLVRAEGWFTEIPGMTPEATEAFITEGFLSFRDLTFFEAADIAEIGGLAPEQAQEVIDYAEDRADEVEEEEEARAEEEREAARNAPKMAVLIEEKPPESTAKEAFDSLFAKEPAADEPVQVAADESGTEKTAEASAEESVIESSTDSPTHSEPSTAEEPKSE